MKCPRCGHEMTVDSHRKIPLQMCYECGYIEGRSEDSNFSAEKETNFLHLKKLNFNETVAFLSQNFAISEEALDIFLEEEYKA